MKNLYLLLFLSTITFFAFSQPAEFELYDGTITWTEAEAADNGFYFLPHPAGAPADWSSYVNGSFYFRYEIISQPTNTASTIQFGIWQYYPSSPWYEGCSNEVNLYGQGSSGTLEHSPSTWYCFGDGCLDFSDPGNFNYFAVILRSKDLEKRIMQSDPEAWAVRNLFLPMQLKVTIVAVKEGASFSGWDYWLNNDAPPAELPSYTIDFLNEITAEPVISTDEYSYDQINWTDGAGSSLDLLPGQTVYFRHKGEIPIQELPVPSRPGAPFFSIDFINEATTSTIPNSVEYSLNENMTGATVGEGIVISVTPGEDLYFQYKATTSSFKSLVFSLGVPERTSAPNYTMNTTTFKTVEIIPSTTEYKTSETSWQSGSDTQLTLTPGVNVHFRYAATSGSLVSAVQEMVVPTVGAPNYSIDYLQEITKENVSTEDEYSSNQTTWISGANSKIKLTPGQTIYFRKKADNTKIQTLIVAPKPSVPAYSINFTSEKTNQNILATDEYSSHPDMSAAISGTGNAIKVNPGVDIYFRTKSTSGSFASEIQHLAVPQKPTTPLYTISYPAETTNETIPATVEYSHNDDLISSVNGTGEKVTIIPGSDIYFRVKSTASSFASSIFMLKVPSRPEAPAITIDYTNEKTNQAILSSMQYSSDSEMTGGIDGTSVKLNVVPGNDLFFRLKSTTESFKSFIQHLEVPNRPVTPSFTIDFEDEKTNEIVSGSYKYSSGSTFSISASGVGLKIDLTPGSDVYFIRDATESSFKSEVQKLEVPSRPVIISSERDTTSKNPFGVVVVFPSSVTGFSANDIYTENCTAGNLTGNYNIDISPSAEGKVAVKIPANVADGGNFKSNMLSLYYKALSGLSEHAENDIDIYPNPSNGELYLELKNASGSNTVQLYNSYGQFIKNFILDDEISFIQINLGKGIYFLRIDNSFKKIIIN